MKYITGVKEVTLNSNRTNFFKIIGYKKFKRDEKFKNI